MTTVLAIMIAAAPPGYGKATWGMSRAEVKRAYPDLRKSKAGTWHHATRVGPIPADRYFHFVGGKLSYLNIISNADHRPQTGHVRDHRTLRNLLTQKYGQPLESHTDWVEDTYRSEDTTITEFAFAVSRGHVTIRTVWIANRTRITLLLSGIDYRAYVGIQYEGMDYDEERAADFRTKDLEQL